MPTSQISTILSGLHIAPQKFYHTKVIKKNDPTFALNYQNYMLNSLVKLTSKYLHKYKHIYSEILRKA